MEDSRIVLGTENFFSVSSHFLIRPKYQFLKNEGHPLGTIAGPLLLGFVHLVSILLIFGSDGYFTITFWIWFNFIYFLKGQLGELIFVVTYPLADQTY